ncbi:MAG: TetR family transcriptional regulator [Bryobacteraceae bacterium]
MEDTRARILTAAERLFAERGFAGASLRAVIGEAKVNLAAIHYYFGSKEKLLEAVFARRLEPLNRARLQMLEDTRKEAGDAPVPLEKILEAFIAPPMRLSRSDAGGRQFLRLLGLMYSEPEAHAPAIIGKNMKEVAAAFLEALARTVPAMPREELLWRIHFVVGAMAHTMRSTAEIELLSGGLCDGSDVEGNIQRMVRYGAAVMRAPGGEACGAEHSRPRLRKRG